MIHIVLGTAFGDEGKGQSVHSLAHPESLVIRFSGGHQCGHTVVTKDGFRHIFSQFGSGTFRGAPTYISAYCTVFPIAFLNEYQALESQNISLPAYFVHPLAMLTTPYDLAFNRALSMITGHGTCGVGFGTTLQRNEDFYNLYVNDMQTPAVFDTKMSFIRKYYEGKVKQMNMSSQITYEDELETAMENWEESLAFYRSFIRIATLETVIPAYKDFIFEGSQGILLDQHFGFFPHVTRSNTSSQNAMEMIRHSALKGNEITTYYLSRCYQTRHGNGPFLGGEAVELIHTELETNQENDWQGVFRTAHLDFSLIEHAVNCDKIYNPEGEKRLIVTCLDQLKDRAGFEEKLKNSSVLDFVDKIETKDCMNWE
jgi:adenylosuccinate synthase